MQRPWPTADRLPAPREGRASTQPLTEGQLPAEQPLVSRQSMFSPRHGRSAVTKPKPTAHTLRLENLGAGAELEGEKEVTFWMLMFWLDFCPTPQVETYLNTEPHCGHHRHAQQERRGRDNGTHTVFFSNGQSGGGSFF